MDKFTIYCIDENGEELIHFDAPSNPFKVGEIFEFGVENSMPDTWTVEDIPKKEYKVVEISHSLDVRYIHQVYRHFTITVILEPRE